MEQKDLIALIKALVNSMESFATRKNLKINIDSQQESYLMDMDEEKMKSIFTNLLSNAVKFTPENGEIKISLTTSELDEQEKVILKVVDSGYGIAKEHLDDIFSRFYQVESEISGKGVGTGIGLALTKELVELLNGEISVASELGTGSVFTVKLPVSRNCEHSELQLTYKEDLIHTSEVATAGTSHFQQDEPLLLIVEDNEDVLNYLISLLQDDYELEIARDGLEGTTKAEELIPDLIITDVMMPKKDGFTLCKELKDSQKTNHIPIIVLTGKAEFEDKMTGLKMGADAYLTKPFRKEELLIRLEKLNQLRNELQVKYSQFALIDNPEALKKENSFIHDVHQIIEQNIDNEIFGVEDLANAVFMSRMQLHRKLKALSDRSASNYIRNFRLHKAKVMLKDLSRTIAEIAFSVGFHDPNYFTKTFQQEFGVTPSEFRSQ